MGQKQPQGEDPPSENTAATDDLDATQPKPWVAGGPSPNPGGRPKGIDGDREEFQKWSSTARAVLVNIMISKKAKPEARIKAAVAVLDRAWGKPTQPLSGAGPDEPPLIPVATDWAALTSGEVRRRIRALREEVLGPDAEAEGSGGDEANPPATGA